MCHDEYERLNIDHEHLRGWAKLPDDERKKYVRGLLCPYDNRVVVGRHKESTRLKAAAKYLDSYHRRKK